MAKNLGDMMAHIHTFKICVQIMHVHIKQTKACPKAKSKGSIVERYTPPREELEERIY